MILNYEDAFSSSWHFLSKEEHVIDCIFKDFNQILLIFEEMEMGVLAFFQKIISEKQILHSLGNGDCVTHLST